jgi:adenylate cyclase
MAFGAVQMSTDALEEGYERCRRAARLADQLGDPTLRIFSGLSCWGLFALGRMQKATDLIDQTIATFGDDRSLGRGMLVTSPWGWYRLNKVHFGTYCGRIDEGLAMLDDVIILLEEEDDSEQIAWAHRHCALFADLAGADPELAAQHARLAVEWADNAGGVWSRIFNREGLASNLCHRGRWDDAVAVADEALTLAGDRRIALADVPLLLSLRARAHVGLERYEQARADAEEGVAVGRRCGARGYEAQALLQLARALIAEPGSPERSIAAKALNEAEAINEGLGITVFAPQIHRERAFLARAAGDEAGYEQSLRRAHQLFLAIGAEGRAAEVAALVGAS